MQRILFNFNLAVEGVFANKLRAFLTALGIIFGVAAVISMLAIGNGAKKAILEQMKLVGSNSIIIKSSVESSGNNAEEENESDNGNGKKKRKWSPGFTMNDLHSIKQVLPTIEETGAEIEFKLQIIGNGKQGKTTVIGIEPSYFSLNNLTLETGKTFSNYHIEHGLPVCIVGKSIQTKYFQGENVIGKKIKIGQNWMTIVGVLKRRLARKESLEKFGLQDHNSHVYIPIQTALIRFENRAKVSAADINSRNRKFDPNENYHQIDRAVIKIADVGYLQASADVIARLLKRRHNNAVDFEIQIPELLIQQQQKTQETFNMVLAVIAGISLLVGGIGIMNIMLASVLERIKEIGVRRSLGAHKEDIVTQFLFEALFICLIGGIIGIILGIVTAHLIAQSADIPTIVSLSSILLSFGVAFLVGVVFGLFPAQRAANYDPIKALRSE